MSKPAIKKACPNKDKEDRRSANDIFQHILGSWDISAEEDPNGNFQEAMKNVNKNTKLLENLQALIASQLAEEKAKEKRIVQKYSPLNAMLDTPLQQKILECLEEEGLWALKESAMMDFGPDDCLVQHQWETLRDKRLLLHHFGDRFDDDMSAEEAGLIFGKTAQFARRMEEAARQHYGGMATQLASLSCQWPDQLHKLSYGDSESADDDADSESADDDICYFVRLSLRHKDRVDAHVFEGFAETTIDDDNHNRLMLYWSRFPEDSRFATLTHEYYDANNYWDMDEWDYEVTDEAADIAERLCEHLTITVIAFKPEDETMEVVVSTTGFHQACPFYMYLTPRSPKAQETDFDPTNCVQVLLGHDSPSAIPFCIWLDSKSDS